MQSSLWPIERGAQIHSKNKVLFKVWAPFHPKLSIELIGKGIYPMNRDEKGFFSLDLEGVQAGDRYYYLFENGLKRPDPVSRSLPNGVHGPTEIIDPEYLWEDQPWNGIDLRESIFYELHVGTFTKKGTFEGVIEKLPYLKELGINIIEIMPIAQFAGRWNWGYDTASLYAPFYGYGGAIGLKRLVDCAHQLGLGVCLDVVYNHFGPEGNYLGEFGPYYSDKYHTPWGNALNFDGPESDHVRQFIIQNALYWIEEYHVDALRLDAIHGIYDFSARQTLPQLVEEVANLSLDRKVHIIAENDLNDSKVVQPKQKGGWEMSAVWNDDFHHAVHVALTGDQWLYYQDFNGIEDIAHVLNSGFVYGGKYSTFRKKTHGSPTTSDLSMEKFIIFTQNHDQIGNSPSSDRLSTMISHELLEVEAFILLMSPSIPLLFMGQEYGEKAPFEYFVDYANDELMQSIYEGRKKEFLRESMPFSGEDSFNNSNLSEVIDSDQKKLLQLYRTLIDLRKKHLPKPGIMKEEINVYFSKEKNWIGWEYLTENKEWVGIFCNLGKKNLRLSSPFKKVKGDQILSTRDAKIDKNEIDIPAESAVILT